MKYYVIILAIIFNGLLLVSCTNLTKEENNSYPNDLTNSTALGQPKDSATFYFPTSITQNGKIIKLEDDTFLFNWFSSSLYASKEPVLYNFYLGYDRYRFLWLRSFHNPVIFVLSKKENAITLTTKELDRQPNFDQITYVREGMPDSITVPDRKANIVVNQTKVVSLDQWNEFQSLLSKCNFWNMTPLDKYPGNDGAEWIIEAHLKNKYWFVDRWTPGNSNYANCGKFLIQLSGNQYRIY